MTNLFAFSTLSSEDGPRMDREWTGPDSFISCRLLFFLFSLLFVGVGSAWGTTTYKLTSVTSVSAGNKYVFVEDGHALTTTGSKKINSTTSFSTSALTGSESYVYLLESATGGYKLKNCSTATYLSNSNADMSLNATGTVWYFTFSNGVALIQNYGSDRFIGETSAGAYTYKAYAYSNLDTYAHDIYVYRLDEEASCSANPSIGDASLNGSFY